MSKIFVEFSTCLIPFYFYWKLTNLESKCDIRISLNLKFLIERLLCADICPLTTITNVFFSEKMFYNFNKSFRTKVNMRKVAQKETSQNFVFRNKSRMQTNSRSTTSTSSLLVKTFKFSYFEHFCSSKLFIFLLYEISMIMHEKFSN